MHKKILITGASGFIGTNLKTFLKSKKAKFKTIKTRSILKKRKTWNAEDLFQNLKEIKSVNLNQYYNSITFLWLSNIIQVDEYNISLKKKNDIK